MFRKMVAVLFVLAVLAMIVPAMPVHAAEINQPESVETQGRTGIWVCKNVSKGCAVYNQRGQLERARAWAMTGRVKSSKIWSIRYSSGVPHSVWAYQAHFTWVGD